MFNGRLFPSSSQYNLPAETYKETCLPGIIGMSALRNIGFSVVPRLSCTERPIIYGSARVEIHIAHARMSFCIAPSILF